MSYEKIILLGTGKLFLDCLSYVKELGIPYAGYDTDIRPRKLTRVQAENKGLVYFIKDRKELFREIRQIKEKILLLSVINPAVIPADILEKDNIRALNCHQALLPGYRGRNAEAWAIYEGEKTAGITWHQIIPEVDGGDILVKKKITVTDTDTAYSLFRKQLQAAYEAFTEFMPRVLQGAERCYPQPQGKSVLHFARELPGGGRLDLSWSGEKMSCFLRAMDYGGLAVMPRPVVCFEDRDYMFKAYEIRRTEEFQTPGEEMTEEDTLRIARPGYEIYLKKCRPSGVEA